MGFEKHERLNNNEGGMILADWNKSYSKEETTTDINLMASVGKIT